jgi:hypothetical protein
MGATGECARSHANLVEGRDRLAIGCSNVILFLLHQRGCDLYTGIVDHYLQGRSGDQRQRLSGRGRKCLVCQQKLATAPLNDKQAIAAYQRFESR